MIGISHHIKTIVDAYCHSLGSSINSRFWNYHPHLLFLSTHYYHKLNISYNIDYSDSFLFFHDLFTIYLIWLEKELFLIFL